MWERKDLMHHSVHILIDTPPRSSCCGLTQRNEGETVYITECQTSYIRVSDLIHQCQTSCIRVSDLMHQTRRHVSAVVVQPREKTRVRGRTVYITECQTSYISVSYLMHQSVIPHTSECHTSCIRVSDLMHQSVRPRASECQTSCIRVSDLVHQSARPRASECQTSCIRVSDLMHQSVRPHASECQTLYIRHTARFQLSWSNPESKADSETKHPFTTFCLQPLRQVSPTLVLKTAVS